MHASRQVRGFTLLEILLVVASISILAGIVITAINPSKQLADTRNAQRRIDVNTILNAIYQYDIDNGIMPATITTTSTAVCRTGGSCATLIDLGVLTTNGTYLVAMPADPTTATVNSTGYNVSKSATTGRVTVNAPSAEQSATISVTR